MSNVNTQKGFASREPVIIGALVTWLFSVAGTFIVGHTSLVTSDQWSGLATVLVPLVSAALIGLVTTLVRRYVTPWWKAVSGHIPGGVVVDLNNPAVQKFVEESVKAELASLGTKYPQFNSILLDIQALEQKAAGS